MTRGLQENLGDDQNASTSKRKPSFAAARAAQKVDRVGGSSSTGNGANDRFWTVLAVGAGAVGSFLAVAVFAIYQYRKVGGQVILISNFSLALNLVYRLFGIDFLGFFTLLRRLRNEAFAEILVLTKALFFFI